MDTLVREVLEVVILARAVPVVLEVVILAQVDLVVECPAREGLEAAIRVAVPEGLVAA